MKLLLTNDDGIDAPGLAALEAALAEVGTLTTVAPHEHLSGCSHQANTARPLQVTAVAPGRYSVDGTPVDCARLGLGHLATDAEWVVSGINAGGNLGSDIHLSGTVAAVREAALLGRRAMAISHYHRSNAAIDWRQAAELARRVFERLQSEPHAPGLFWNVNLPHLPPDSPAPEIVFCPLDLNPLPVDFELHEGRYHYRGRYHDRARTPGADVALCFAGQITVTRLSFGQAEV